MRKFTVLFSSVMILAGSAFAEQVKGDFGAWHAAKNGKGKDKECYVYAYPENKVEEKRQNPYVMVLLNGKDKYEFSATAGFILKNDSLAIRIDGKHAYRLFSDEKMAWLKTEKEDQDIVAKMKAGEKLVVKSISKLNNEFTDNYSLNGFGKALTAARKACSE